MINFSLNIVSLLISSPLTAIRAGLLGVLVLFCLASPAAARLSGEVEWGYTNFSVSRDGDKVGDYSAFTQNYSVYNQLSGVVGDQRLGQYTLGLGYQWTAINTSTDGDDYSTDQGKVLYDGEVTIAPGGLPFRLSAYSYDTQAPVYLARKPRYSALDRSVVYGLQNGQSVTTGANFTAGIRNGSYLGKYRRLLSMFPRILLDYKQYYLRDMEGVFRTHNRTRDLAFVSLNKKDNWFHYRYSEFEDFMDSTNDTSRKTYILGLVDHQLRRRWIHMTNWLQISVDGSYVEEDSAEYEKYRTDPKLYRLNLFARADFNKTHLASYGNYSRETNNDSIVKDIDLPFYANGSIDPNRSWNFQMELSSHDENAYSDGSITDNNNISYDTYDEDVIYLRGSMTLGQQQPVKYVPQLELELNRQAMTNGFAVRHKMEIVNNALFSGRQPFLLGYSATYVKGDVDDDAKVLDDLNGSLAENDDILELDMYGSTEWVLTPRNTFQATQTFRYNTGEARFSPTSYITAKGSFLSGSYSNKPEASASSSYSSATSFSLETRFRSGWRSRFNLDNMSSFGGSNGSKQTTTLQHSLVYQKPKFNYNGTTRLLFGDDLQSSSLSLSRGNVETSSRAATNPVDINYIIEHESKVSYSPNRAFQSTVSFDYSWIDTDSEDAYRGTFNEQSQYSFYSLSGHIHKVSEIYQEIEYEEYSSNDVTASYLKMLAGIGYFPRPFFELGGELLYEAYDPEDIKTLQVSVVASLEIAKLTWEGRYTYGLSKIKDASFDEQKEHLFETKIKRAF